MEGKIGTKRPHNELKHNSWVQNNHLDASGTITTITAAATARTTSDKCIIIIIITAARQANRDKVCIPVIVLDACTIIGTEGPRRDIVSINEHGSTKEERRKHLHCIQIEVCQILIIHVVTEPVAKILEALHELPIGMVKVVA